MKTASTSARLYTAAVVVIGIALCGCQPQPASREESAGARQASTAHEPESPPTTARQEPPEPELEPKEQEQVLSNTEPISALVWMRAEQRDEGATLAAPATPGAERKAVEHFRSLGFVVTEPQYGQFSIEGPTKLFEEALGEELNVQVRGEGMTEARTAAGSLELNKQRLPPEIAATVHVVTFSEPPAFGPSSY